MAGLQPSGLSPKKPVECGVAILNDMTYSLWVLAGVFRACGTVVARLLRILVTA